MNDQVIEGTWVCDGTGATIATATGPGTGGPLFKSTQPNNHGGKEHCAVSHVVFDFLLGDISCEQPNYYLCEKP